MRPAPRHHPRNVCLFSSLLFTFALCSAVSARVVNVTVDDVSGDERTGSRIEYTPGMRWNTGPACAQTCLARPESSRASKGGWHEAYSGFNRDRDPRTGLAYADLTFQGTAIYVFCILAKSIPDHNFASNMTFFVDGQQAGTFEREPLGDGDEDFMYNVSVFSATNLSARSHDLRIQNGRRDGEHNPPSLILLDFLVYTTDDGLPSTSSGPSLTYSSPSGQTSTTQGSANLNLSGTNHNAKIIGSVVGSLIAILLTVVAIVVYRRRRHRTVDPALGETPPTTPPKDRSLFAFAPAWLRCSRKGSHQGSDIRTRPRNRIDSIAFNPNLLVRRIAASTRSRAASLSLPRSQRRQSVVPVPREHRNLPYIIDPMTSRELLGHGSQPARGSGVPLMSSPIAANFATIQAWQRQTEAETRDTRKAPRNGVLPDMSEELSSYYDDNPSESNRVHTPPPPLHLPRGDAPLLAQPRGAGHVSHQPRPQRPSRQKRFTVMNA